MANKLLKLIGDIVTSLDSSVDLVTPLVDTLVVEQAEGVWLDTIGSLVGAPPRTLDINNNSPVNDVEYRKRINVQIELNNAGSTNQAIATAVQYYLYLTDNANWDQVKTQYVEMIQAEATLYINVPEADAFPYAGEVKKFIPVGVGMYIIAVPSVAFVVSDLDDLTPIPNTDGCGDINDLTAGGELAYFVDYNSK